MPLRYQFAALSGLKVDFQEFLRGANVDARLFIIAGVPCDDVIKAVRKGGVILNAVLKIMK